MERGQCDPAPLGFYLSLNKVEQLNLSAFHVVPSYEALVVSFIS